MAVMDVTVMNVVMIYDIANDSVLVQTRTKKWKGGCFPGGHFENGESINDSAVREIREETGLEIKNLVPCGVVHWDKGEGRHEFIWCYRTKDFSGELTQCDEGINHWVKREDLQKESLTKWFREQLPLFFCDSFTELSHIYNSETDKFSMRFYPELSFDTDREIPAFTGFPENR